MARFGSGDAVQLLLVFARGGAKCRAVKYLTNSCSAVNLNLSLTPELDRYVAPKVASGRYRTASEVVGGWSCQMKKADL